MIATVSLRAESEAISVDEIVHKMKNPRIGALLTYLGTVREFPSGNGLEFEDDKNTVQKLEEMEKRAIDRFDIEDVAIIHRVGLKVRGMKRGCERYSNF